VARRSCARRWATGPTGWRAPTTAWPVRARGLLARYLAEHPSGNLAEEALALSIEAALAHHDADVAAVANRYLRLYPQGSFAALARQARDAQ
jgi:hypothetical protein